MSFVSLTFVFFLALVFGLYWVSRRRLYQNIVLIAASYTFYMWWDYRYSVLLLTSSLVDYVCALCITKAGSGKKRTLFLLTSLATNLTLLGFFKYYNFFVESFSSLLSELGFQVDWTTMNIILPVGISFYTFQTLSYTIDVYRGKMSATKNIVDYLAYVSFFPQLVAGPIERARNILPQLARAREFSYCDAIDGCKQVLWGFFKKMVLAENLALIVDVAYKSVADSTGPQLFIATACFGFQIYFDFSAYSDIAIGTGKLFGIKLMRNFAYPYFSQSLSEFWRRWHISLETWFRDYIYIPLGGSRVSLARRLANVMVVFLLSGLWHGASWHFIVWGGLNGLLLIPSIILGRNSLRSTEVPGGERILPSFRALGKILVVFFIITLTWVFFRAQSVPESLLVLKKIFVESLSLECYRTLGLAMLEGKTMVVVVVSVVLMVEWVQRSRPHPLELGKFPVILRFITYTAVFWMTLILTTLGNKPFLYFQF